MQQLQKSKSSPFQIFGEHRGAEEKYTIFMEFDNNSTLRRALRALRNHGVGRAGAGGMKEGPLLPYAGRVCIEAEGALAEGCIVEVACSVTMYRTATGAAVPGREGAKRTLPATNKERTLRTHTETQRGRLWMA